MLLNSFHLRFHLYFAFENRPMQQQSAAPVVLMMGRYKRIVYGVRARAAKKAPAPPLYNLRALPQRGLFVFCATVHHQQLVTISEDDGTGLATQTLYRLVIDDLCWTLSILGF